MNTLSETPYFRESLFAFRGFGSVRSDRVCQLAPAQCLFSAPVLIGSNTLGRRFLYKLRNDRTQIQTPAIPGTPKRAVKNARDLRSARGLCVNKPPTRSARSAAPTTPLVTPTTIPRNSEYLGKAVLRQQMKPNPARPVQTESTGRLFALRSEELATKADIKQIKITAKTNAKRIPTALVAPPVSTEACCGVA